MFVLNPDPYLLPSYRISPFQTKDIVKNHLLQDNDRIDSYFNNRFEGQIIYTENGREAIRIALEQLELNKNDVVTILTTTGNFYISGCVTKEIEKFCQWSREILPETKVFFINHEFGYAFEDIEKLKNTGIPIIEDCASSFFTKGNNIGTIGDYIIYSFPKMFPIQIGGLLINNTTSNIQHSIDKSKLNYIKSVLSKCIDKEDKIVAKRWKNYHYLRTEFSKLGIKERFEKIEGNVPSVFMFKTTGSKLNLPHLKEHFYNHGIQCSVFYGEEAFFLPVHQRLGKEDLDYFISVFKLFLTKYV
nr:DegT/DnrJ/EryC1/StrS family aminotransferase [uncultured Carboxylicivirga sp.]